MILLLSVSCAKQGMVNINAGGPDNFPVMTIDNPNGAEITIQPVADEAGSIGLEREGEIIWLKGKPEKIKNGEGITTFKWNTDTGGSIELTVSEVPGEIDFYLKYTNPGSDKKPDRWFINIAAGKNEYFTGAFERVVDGNQANSWKPGITTAMNLRNEIVEMKVRYTVSAYSPFYISSNNYGLFVEGTWPGVYDFCKSNPDMVRISFEGPELSYKIYLESTPMEIVKKHTLETGPPFVPPRWAFGPWRWRDDHNNNKTYFDGSSVDAPFNSDIVEDVLMMEAYGIPCTAYWIDRPWGTGSFGFDDYNIDYERLPEFEKMIPWLNGKNMELMMWICPWVYGDMADTAIKRGYDLTGRTIRPMMMPVPPSGPARTGPPQQGPGLQGSRPPLPVERMAIMDYTNPEAVKWWGENGPAKLARLGVRGFKLDRGDGERNIDSTSLKTFSGITYRENFNDYPHQFVKATYEAVQPVLGDNFILFPRAQYTGSSRYGAMWAGDTDNSAEGLRSALIAMQRCAIMGYPNWGSDAGGYPQHLDREVTMRWLGFACFSPIMEVGPTNNRGFWGMNGDPSWDHEMLAVWHFYTNLRMSLIDYVHNLAKTAAETGEPAARPLFLDYPGQAECWNDWTSYKFGDDLLISLVWEKGRTKQKLFLPEGETWINLWDKQEYQGGQYIEVDAPVYQIPVFLRKGSDLSLPDLSQMYVQSVQITSVKYDMDDLEVKEGWK